MKALRERIERELRPRIEAEIRAEMKARDAGAERLKGAALRREIEERLSDFNKRMGGDG